MTLFELSRDFFSYLVSFKEQAATSNPPRLINVRADLESLLALMDTQAKASEALSRSYEWVRPIMLIFADEVLTGSGWSLSRKWAENNLELRHLGEAEGGRRYFRMLSELEDAPNDVIAIFHLCLSLGFHGPLDPGDPKLENIKQSLAKKLPKPETGDSAPRFGGGLHSKAHLSPADPFVDPFIEGFDDDLTPLDELYETNGDMSRRRSGAWPAWIGLVALLLAFGLAVGLLYYYWPDLREIWESTETQVASLESRKAETATPAAKVGAKPKPSAPAKSSQPAEAKKPEKAAPPAPARKIPSVNMQQAADVDIPTAPKPDKAAKPAPEISAPPKPEKTPPASPPIVFDPDADSAAGFNNRKLKLAQPVGATMELVQPGAKPRPAADSGFQPAPQHQPKPEPVSETKTKPSPEPESKPQLKSGAGPETKPESITESKTKPGPKPDPKNEPKAEPEPAPMPAPKPESQIRPAAKPGAEKAKSAKAAQTGPVVFYLQVGSFKNPEGAKILIKRLEGHGFPAVLVTIPMRDGKGDWQVVVCGPYDTKEGVMKDQKAIEEKARSKSIIRSKPRAEWP